MTAGILTLMLMLAQFTQTNAGELRVIVTDDSGLPVQSTVELVSEANQFHERYDTDAHGLLVARRLPFGAYRLSVAREGFATFTGLLDIHSALPTEYRVTLGLAPLQAQVTV